MSAEEEAYKLLEDNYVIVPKHVKNLFNKLSLVGLRVWANLVPSQVELHENVIRQNLTVDTFCQSMSYEDRKDLFGQIFAQNPKGFRFLPGDLQIINLMREVSQELLKKKKKVAQRTKSKKLTTDIKKEAKEQSEKSKVDVNKNKESISCASNSNEAIRNDGHSSWNPIDLNSGVKKVGGIGGPTDQILEKEGKRCDGRDGGSICIKCNQEGHKSYNCPTASTESARNSPSNGAHNSSTPSRQPVFEDWGMTAKTVGHSSNYDFSEKIDQWGSVSSNANRAWANGANATPRGARKSKSCSSDWFNEGIGRNQGRGRGRRGGRIEVETTRTHLKWNEEGGLLTNNCPTGPNRGLGRGRNAQLAYQETGPNQGRGGEKGGGARVGSTSSDQWNEHVPNPIHSSDSRKRVHEYNKETEGKVLRGPYSPTVANVDEGLLENKIFTIINSDSE